ncbi:LPS export ABC transporter periplasmic protein LptC [Chelativorans sp. AA-79]|uniref:LPS export ABC transporter periplasmic protein LptC n=1 Tax=Chelativorans sp. AA-79 TaxID=3028735 RepID=UPI0023F727E7|nr:LPS export ABC transporter periplasmic protein LptC [Chelativorans sp. AA-79]WEX09553.1 LPS export ABC transporter periplasmic protein LptC [Chelativorans sp. AA-79]
MNSIAKAEMSGISAPATRHTERGAEAFARAVRHSRRVRALKFILPAAAIVVSGLFFGYSLLSPTGLEAIDLDSATIEGGSLVMHNPSLNGFTSEDLPYSMTAERARQPIGSDTGPIELEKIRATLPIDEEHKATISAGGGVFDRQANKLVLDDEITVTMSSGIVARLQSANVDIESNDLATDDPVEIEMEGMRVNADTFQATEGGSKLIFEKRVRVELDPARLRQRQESGEQ